MILSTIPFLVRCVMVYFSTLAGAALPAFAQVSAGFFEAFLRQQMFFTFAISIYAGAGLIANDLKANALQIYLSKAITRRDYFLGKLGVLAFFLSLPTLLPSLLLFLIAVLFKADAVFFLKNVWLLGPIFGYSVLIIFTYALTVLALSAMTRSSRFAGINFAALFFFSQILYGILSVIFRSSRIGWIAVGNNLAQIGAALFDVTLPYKSPVWVSLLILLVLMAASAWAVHRKIQAVEVVS
jgi:ABC-type transport system involved in multi-copper enzyme maturation permease subunit